LKHIIKKESANESFFKINPTEGWILLMNRYALNVMFGKVKEGIERWGQGSYCVFLCVCCFEGIERKRKCLVGLTILNT